MAAVRKDAKAPVLRENRIIFQNSLREKLASKYLDSGSANVVILCHGFLSHKDANFLPDLARALALKKLSSLRFDFSGNGESDGVLEYSPYSREVADLRAAVMHVRNTLRKNVVAIVGHSQGANDVVQYAGQYDDVPLVINISGRFDCTRGIEERFGAEMLAKVDKLGQVLTTVATAKGPTKMVITKQRLAERRATNMATVCGKITISEVLTVHGTADTTIPVEDAQQFARNIRQHVLQLVEGADHCYTNPVHAEQLIKHIIDFINANL